MGVHGKRELIFKILVVLYLIHHHEFVYMLIKHSSFPIFEIVVMLGIGNDKHLSLLILNQEKQAKDL